MRKGEIVNLTWNKVDVKNRMIRLKAEDTKEKQPKKIPISKTLRSILLKLPGRGKDGFVFQFKGAPINDLRTGLKDGCEKAGINYGRNAENGFTFHDLRHTFRTYARRAGIDRNVIMTTMGHSNSNDMSYRYDTIDEADLLNAIDQYEAYFENVDQSVDQGQKNSSR